MAKEPIPRALVGKRDSHHSLGKRDASKTQGAGEGKRGVCSILRLPNKHRTAAVRL